jgi:hypothetical protein
MSWMMEKKLKNKILIDRSTLLVDLEIQVTLPNWLDSLNWCSQPIGVFYKKSFIKIELKVWLKFELVKFMWTLVYSFMSQS